MISLIKKSNKRPIAEQVREAALDDKLGMELKSIVEQIQVRLLILMYIIIHYNVKL
jgi:hypothetical protein